VKGKLMIAAVICLAGSLASGKDVSLGEKGKLAEMDRRKKCRAVAGRRDRRISTEERLHAAPCS
jgi:hypothetical protein